MKNASPLVPQERIHTYVEGMVFRLEDHIRHSLYWWPQTPVRYAIDFSQNPVRREALSLRYLDDQEVVFQLSEVREDGDGRLLIDPRV